MHLECSSFCQVQHISDGNSAYPVHSGSPGKDVEQSASVFPTKQRYQFDYILLEVIQVVWLQA